MPQLRTPQEVKEQFDKEGRSIAAWAAEHQVPLHSVYLVLSGKSAAKRGATHRAAVLLGIKDGVALPAVAK